MAMQTYHIETVIQQDGTLILDHLPLKAGAIIQVIIQVQPGVSSHSDRYPLRGMPVLYLNPTEPVAESDWSAMLHPQSVPRVMMESSLIPKPGTPIFD